MKRLNFNTVLNEYFYESLATREEKIEKIILMMDQLFPENKPDTAAKENLSQCLRNMTDQGFNEFYNTIKKMVEKSI